MARLIKILTSWQVATLDAPGRHADGGGLYLKITSEGSRSWIVMMAHAGQLSEVGLGCASSVSLGMARRLAGEMQEAAAAGQDPRTVITPTVSEERNTIPTFGAFARNYITSVERGWKDPKYQQDWRNTLRDHAKLLLGKPIDQIGTDEVLAVLRPIWLQIPRTAQRLRGRIETILEAAKERGFRPENAINPATWRGHLALLLPSHSKLTVGHYPALSWTETPTFMADLRSRQALAARCLEFVILTAARSGEVLGSTWGEMDLESKLWIIPAARMSAGIAHVVPMSSSAVALLKDLRPKVWQPDMRVFAVNDAPLSERAMSMLLRRMKRDSITTHGFRSTFQDWAKNATNCPGELVKQAIAYTGSNKAERVCRREADFVRRRELMEAWSEFLKSPSN